MPGGTKADSSTPKGVVRRPVLLLAIALLGIVLAVFVDGARRQRIHDENMAEGRALQA